MMAKKNMMGQKEEKKGKVRVDNLKGNITDVSDGQQKLIKGGEMTLRERRLEMERLLRDKQVTGSAQ